MSEHQSWTSMKELAARALRAPMARAENRGEYGKKSKDGEWVHCAFLPWRSLSLSLTLKMWRGIVRIRPSSSSC